MMKSKLCEIVSLFENPDGTINEEELMDYLANYRL